VFNTSDVQRKQFKIELKEGLIQKMRFKFLANAGMSIIVKKLGGLLTIIF